jgi:hypothetical protein
MRDLIAGWELKEILMTLTPSRISSSLFALNETSFEHCRILFGFHFLQRGGEIPCPITDVRAHGGFYSWL